MRVLSISIACLILVSCNSGDKTSSGNMAQVDCANGFAPTGKSVSMGSQASVDLVKSIDSEWAKMDLEAMRKFYSDTCVFEWNDGDHFQAAC